MPGGTGHDRAGQVWVVGAPGYLAVDGVKVRADGDVSG
jgi:hypothetical protein